ncbi:MAG: ribonuclease J [Patescibacteria group bacterium]|jgi:ribonuclease J
MNSSTNYRRNAPKKEFKGPAFSAMKKSHKPQRKPSGAFRGPAATSSGKPVEEKADKKNLSLDQWLSGMDVPANRSVQAKQAALKQQKPGGFWPKRDRAGNYQAGDSRQKQQTAIKTAREQFRQPLVRDLRSGALRTGQTAAATATGVKGSDKLRIIPIGGYEEVGRNMTIFEYKNDIVILDMGIQFPEEDMPGIDYIIPNIEYLRGKEKNVKGVIFSHGHLDHIGAAPILLEKLGNPTIVGRPLTIALVKHRVEDYKKDGSKKLKVIMVQKISDRLKLGAFDISFFPIDHSIMDAVGVIIKTPVATVIHPGDWTLEKDKNGKPLLGYDYLAKLPRPTILMLESLGAIDIRESATTEEMQKNITRLITEAPGRMIIGTFSSQIERISWIIATCEKLNKKVALMGYSMKNNVEIAKKLGYIKYQKNSVIRVEDIDQYPEKKIVILCTGSQGEGNAALSRIIDGNDKSVKLRKNDTVILSSSVIPGNERTIQRLKDNLYRQCDNVIHGNIMDIHVSGHGNREDIAYMLKSIKPDYFIPSYANHYMLKEAAKLAQDIGFSPNRIFVPDNGSIIEFDGNNAGILSKKVPASYVFVDGLGITDMNNIVLRDRQQLAEDGMLVIIATVDAKTGELIQSPDIISRGFVYLKENKRLIEMTRIKIKKILKDNNPVTAPDDQYLKEKLRNEIGKFLFQKTEKRPMILPVIIEV